MLQKIHIICLRTVRYSDTANILSAYSLENGRVSFLINDGKGRESSRRRALTQPLSLLECVADVRPGRDISRLSELRALSPLTAIRTNPVKCSLAIFIAEVLTSLLRESNRDEAVWRYIEQSVLALDEVEAARAANFHLWFLYGMGRCLGVSPDASGYYPGMVFDIDGGVFRKSAPLHRNYVSAERSGAVALLERMTLENMHLFRFTREQRGEVLDGILHFLSIHHAPLSGLKSLDVLRALF
ncbi:MAG: DNA repair protein RecO [Paramuribaculum sp.]|nr:DNA repair protein RecO [Paramuribaculum sp.]